MSKTPKGGPATINGILYQMLYALLTISKLKVDRIEKDKDKGIITGAQLILEPEGGGDQQQVKNNQRIVEQLKARTTNLPWSLQEIIEDVLPDLYKAVDLNKPDCQYKFITESHMGDWEEILNLFGSLKSKSVEVTNFDKNILNYLDNSNLLKFGRKHGKSSYWGDKDYTARSLFGFIVGKLIKNKAMSGEKRSLVQKKLWILLSNFEFDAGKNKTVLSKEIDAILSEIIPFIEQMKTIKQRLLCSLLEKASNGNVLIDADVFFKEHGIDAIPLRNTVLLVKNSVRLLKSTLKIHGYNPTLDVRPFSKKELKALKSGDKCKQITVLHGESGNGKSWNMYALANLLAHENKDIIVFINATGNCERDLSKIATKFNEDIWGHDFGPSLNRIAKRFEELNIRNTMWVFVDDIQNTNEAYDLICQPWESWGFQLVMSCQGDIKSLQQLDERFDEKEIKQYSLKELSEHLKKHTSVEWHDVPDDIRDTIRKPVLADIFCKIPNPLKADNEYYLYNSFWQRIDLNRRLDNVGLLKLVFSLLKDVTYPWTGQQVLDAGIDSQQYERLNKIGWLRVTCDGRYEIPYSRLLNWAVAEGIVNAYQNGGITEEEIAEYFSKIFIDNKSYGGQTIGYVPMDVVWICTNRNCDISMLEIILSKISNVYHVADNLYSNLLPTIGSKILPFLFDGLIRLIRESGTEYLMAQPLIKGITSFEPFELEEYLTKMLSSDCKLLHRYAAKIIAQCPSPIFLDRLWKLHCEATQKPDDFFQYESDSHHFVYRDTFDALKSCVKINPLWIESKIKEASSKEPVHDLAYLLANIDDGKEIWLRCKKDLFGEIAKDRERSLATNICKWKDTSEKQWCVDRISIEKDMLGSSALKALSVISPDDAIKYMGKAPNALLYLTRNSAPKDLLIQMPEKANAQILDILKSSDIPLWSSLIYQGNESLMSEEVYDLILDEFDKYLKQLLDPKSEYKKINIYPIVCMLPKIGNLALLKCLQKRKGGSLEGNLKAWLHNMGSRKFRGPDCLEREPALDILYKIGGDAFVEIINEYLETGNEYGRYDAIKESQKRYNNATIEILKNISMDDNLWDNYPFVQSEAARVLCNAEQWQSVFGYIEKWGLKVSKDITGCLRNTTIESINNRYDSISSESDLTEGMILSLGFAKRYDKLTLIRAVSQKADPESSIAFACTIALGELQDSDSIDFLKKQIFISKHSFAAKRSLSHILENGDGKAAGCLFDFCKKEFDIMLALYLVNKKYHVTELLDLIIKKLENAHWFEKRQMVEMHYKYFLNLTNRQIIKILNNQKISTFIQNDAFEQEGGVWITGSKCASIRLLSRIDKNEAFKAAKKSFQNPLSHDRTMYPRLLIDIDKKRGVKLLIEQLKSEKNRLVLFSICRALSKCNIIDKLKEMIKSKNFNDRKAAYIMLSWQRNTNIDFLYNGLADPVEEVSEVAREGILRHKQLENVNEVIQAYNAESNRFQKWIYLDLLLDFADPGDEHQDPPYWVDEIWENADIGMRNYLWEQLKKKQEDLRKKLEK